MDQYSIVLCVVVVCLSRIAFKITIEKVDIFHKLTIEKIYVIFTSNVDNLLYRVVITPYKIGQYYYNYKLPFLHDED